MLRTPGSWRVETEETQEFICIEPCGFTRVIDPDDEDLREEEFKQAKIDAQLIAAAPVLLEELKASHRIIHNALNIMNDDQKREWGDRNERDGVKDGLAVTREEARRTAIAKAEGT